MKIGSSNMAKKQNDKVYDRKFHDLWNWEKCECLNQRSKSPLFIAITGIIHINYFYKINIIFLNFRILTTVQSLKMTKTYGLTSGYCIMTMYFPTQHRTFYCRTIPLHSASFAIKHPIDSPPLTQKYDLQKILSVNLLRKCNFKWGMSLANGYT